MEKLAKGLAAGGSAMFFTGLLIVFAIVFGLIVYAVLS